MGELCERPPSSPGWPRCAELRPAVSPSSPSSSSGTPSPLPSIPTRAGLPAHGGVTNATANTVGGALSALIGCRLMQQQLKYCPQGSAQHVFSPADTTRVLPAWSSRQKPTAGKAGVPLLNAEGFNGAQDDPIFVLRPDPSPPWSHSFRRTAHDKRSVRSAYKQRW